VELYTTATIPTRQRTSSELSSTLVFPCETLALFCDGGGAVYFVHTGHRRKDTRQEWKHGAEPMYDFEQPTHLVRGEIDQDVVHLLSMSLVDRKEDDGTMLCVFYWLQIKVNFDDVSKSVVKGVKRFLGKDVPNAVWLTKDFSQLLIAASKAFHLVDEDLQRIEPPKLDAGEQARIYDWSQTKELVTVSFHLCVTENEVECEIKHNAVSIRLKNGKVMLAGQLEKDIIIDASRWYVAKNQLEVVLVKKVEGEFWMSVVPADTTGSHLIEGEEAARIQEIGESLSHLTSENETGNHHEQTQSFNMAQLEDCDDYGEEDMKLFSIDVFSGEVITQKNFAGHQWLFTHACDDTPPLVCLRHDVDGILWKPGESSAWEHIATFDAFGYVHASKQNSKFTLCSPDFKYAFITDCTSHLYIYDSAGVDATQHNQYVHGFVGSSRIVGCQATDTHLYVLTDLHLNIITLP